MAVWYSSLAVIFLSLCSAIHSLGSPLRFSEREKLTFQALGFPCLPSFAMTWAACSLPQASFLDIDTLVDSCVFPWFSIYESPGLSVIQETENKYLLLIFSPQGTKPARASLLSALCSTDPGRWFPADPEEAATAPAASHCEHCAVLWQATPQCQVTSYPKPGMTRVIKSGEHSRWMRLSSN